MYQQRYCRIQLEFLVRVDKLHQSVFINTDLVGALTSMACEHQSDYASHHRGSAGVI